MKIFKCLFVVVVLLCFVYAVVPDRFQERAFYQTAAGTTGGNAAGPVTVVAFEDYNCMPCRYISAKLQQLSQQESQLRILYVDFPMLGEGSTVAAIAALASVEQSRYLTFHAALMESQGWLNPSKVMQIAAQAGVDVERLELAMPVAQKTLMETLSLGQSLGIQAVPFFVVANTQAPHEPQVLQGADWEALQQAILARKTDAPIELDSMWS